MPTENDRLRLKQWLGEMYRADKLGGGGRDDVFRRAASTVQADPALLEAAKADIPELERVCRVRGDSGRAHVEQVTLEFLRFLTTEAVSG